MPESGRMYDRICCKSRLKTTSGNIRHHTLYNQGNLMILMKVCFSVIFLWQIVNNTSKQHTSGQKMSIAGQTDRRTERQKDGQADGWTDGWMDGWTYRWTDGRMDGWMDGWMDG